MSSFGLEFVIGRNGNIESIHKHALLSSSEAPTQVSSFGLEFVTGRNGNIESIHKHALLSSSEAPTQVSSFGLEARCSHNAMIVQQLPTGTYRE